MITHKRVLVHFKQTTPLPLRRENEKKKFAPARRY
jgi:hypothetical protein